MKRSIGWVCSVCGIDTKDALCDTEPVIPPNAKKEELPDFMITYKPETAIENEEKKAEGSKSSVTNAVIEQPVNTEEQPVQMKENKESAFKTNRSDFTEIPAPALNDQHVIPPLSNQHVNAANNSSGQVRSPLWLDALIGGLVSIVLGLVFRKFII